MCRSCVPSGRAKLGGSTGVAGRHGADRGREGAAGEPGTLGDGLAKHCGRVVLGLSGSLEGDEVRELKMEQCKCSREGWVKGTPMNAGRALVELDLRRVALVGDVILVR